jgi:hypothetical protein
VQSTWPQRMREYEITQLLCKFSDQQAVDSGPLNLEQCAGREARTSREIVYGLAVGEVLWAVSSEVDCGSSEIKSAVLWIKLQHKQKD